MDAPDLPPHSITKGLEELRRTLGETLTETYRQAAIAVEKTAEAVSGLGDIGSKYLKVLNRCTICFDIALNQDSGFWTPEQASEEMARHQQGCMWHDCTECGQQFKVSWSKETLCDECLGKIVGFCKSCQNGSHALCHGSISRDAYGNAAFCTCPESHCGANSPNFTRPVVFQ